MSCICYTVEASKEEQVAKAEDKEKPDIIEQARVLWKRFSAISPVPHASSIAFFTFLSLVPMLAIAISLLSMVGLNETDVMAFFNATVPEELTGTIQLLVTDAFARSGIAFSISTLVLLWSVSKGAKALCAGLNAAYGEEETRSAFAVRALSIATGVALAALLAVVIFLMFSGVLSAIISGLFPGLSDQEAAFRIALVIVAAILGTALFAACYTFLPADKRRYTQQLPGAALAMVSCGLLSLGFRIYINYFANVTALYGSIATIALLMLWIYFTALVIIAGGFFNRLVAERKAGKDIFDTKMG